MSDLYRDCWTEYHSDGTDYLSAALEQRIMEAIAPYVAMQPNSLAPIAALRTVVDWIEEHGLVDGPLYRIGELADDEERPLEVWQDQGLGFNEYVGVLVEIGDTDAV